MKRYIGAALVAAAATLVLLVATAFGSGVASSKSTIVIGTTDQLVSFDPAASGETDNFNIYQSLLRIAPGGNTPTPDLAKSCAFKSATTYVCTLKSGQKFSNGQALTAKDVKFSFDRLRGINADTGLAYLFSSLDTVAASNDTTVVFTLKQHDSTWPFLLSTAAAVIVPSGAYSATALQTPDKIVGSGPYRLVSYKPNQQAVYAPNPLYGGQDKPQNKLVIVQFFDQSSSLKLAIERGDVDVAYRSLTPTDIKSLSKNKNVRVVTGPGAEIRYMVFNLKLPPADKAAARRAVAYVIDRASIAKNVYNDTVVPLYSMVPAGYAGHVDAYAKVYGTTPSVAKARAELQKAGVATPVQIEIWYTPSHYGPNSADEYTEIKRQLEASGLFKVTLNSTEWQQYAKTALRADQYPVFELGWFPDYPDATDYTTPFYGSTAILGNHYASNRLVRLINDTLSTSSDKARLTDLQKIQMIAAVDAPTIPVWQGKQLAVVRSNVHGIEKTLDPSFTLRFALISKS
jgi:peptide/nickel transport system substrate-binding protein